MTLELFFTITWCFVKPLLFFVAPTMIIAEHLLNSKTRKKRNRHCA